MFRLARVSLNRKDSLTDTIDATNKRFYHFSLLQHAGIDTSVPLFYLRESQGIQL